MTQDTRINYLRRQLVAASLGSLAARGAWAQDNAARNRELYLYKGADREARLIEGAKKEGLVQIFTSMNLKDSQTFADQFKKKFGVTAEVWRASSEMVQNRGSAEAGTNIFSCDVFETNAPEMELLSRKGVLGAFYSRYFSDLPPGAFPKHRNYVADRFNFFTLAYNTKLIKSEDVPNTLEDLLHPRFAGMIGIETGDSDWFAAVIKSMGEEKGQAYFKALAATKPQMYSGHSFLAAVVAIGQASITPALYNHTVEKLLAQRGTINWKPLQPTFGRAGVIGPALNAPHPHGAMLFIDFMLSPAGQSILVKRNRVPSSTAVETKLNKFPYEMIDPVISLDQGEKWDKLWSNLFLGGKIIKKEAE